MPTNHLFCFVSLGNRGPQTTEPEQYDTSVIFNCFEIRFWDITKRLMKTFDQWKKILSKTSRNLFVFNCQDLFLAKTGIFVILTLKSYQFTNHISDIKFKVLFQIA